MMKGVEIWGFESEWKETESSQTTVKKNTGVTKYYSKWSVCVRKVGSPNTDRRIVGRVIKRWQRLSEMDEMSLLGDALKQ